MIMTKQSFFRPPPLVEVFPHGDVILVCGRKYGPDVV
jgi:hypothetical protein